MMESLGLRCGKPVPFTRSGRGVDEQSRINCSFRNHLSMKKLKPPIKPLKITRACATTTGAAATPPVSPSSLLSSCSWDQQQNKKMPSEKLDEWIRDSVSEIVKNIGEAPFLVHVYSPSMKTATRLELNREKVVEDSWSSIRRRWREGCPIPDGVILVEQLGQENRLKPVDDSNQGDGSGAAATGTRVWGVLIQGRGADTVACYILKTCRVWSSLGFCTHFCLVKAKCFGETAELQLQNSWNGISN